MFIIVCKIVDIFIHLIGKNMRDKVYNFIWGMK